MRVSVVTFGCKVNQCDSEEIQELLSLGGAEVVDPGEGCDFVVVNGCAVTERASSEARRFVRRVERTSPHARPVLTGCPARLGNSILPRGQGILLAPEKEDLKEWFGSDGNGNGSSSGSDFRRRTRAFVKVQEGCSERCSFCIVPFVRGDSRSIEIADAVQKVSDRVNGGAKEVVVVGTDLGGYGKGNRTPGTLIELIERIERLAGEFRIRLSSIEPRHLTHELIKALSSSRRLCRHFHIPVQSGDDSVLRRMGRGYEAEEVGEKLKVLKSEIPDASLGTDVIVGFPGEGDDSFGRTVKFLGRHPFSYFHVFRFSPRPGTMAFSMRDTVEEIKMRERAAVLRSLGEEKRRNFAESLNGKVVQVVTLGNESTDVGLTDSYVKVSLSRKVEGNSLMDVVLEGTGGVFIGNVL